MCLAIGHAYKVEFLINILEFSASEEREKRDLDPWDFAALTVVLMKTI